MAFFGLMLGAIPPVLHGHQTATKPLTPLAQEPVWLALIHSNGQEAFINHPSFLLSYGQFSPAAELDKTLDLFKQQPRTSPCRYPARYQWLQAQLSLPVFDFAGCAPIKEMMERAPADEIFLVFASENVSQPSSMMGHVMLKLSGRNAQGQPVEHAISFFTQTQGVNIPKLFYQSIVTGKQGFFALTPFHEKILQYRQAEQRNVWQYRLRADEQVQLRLILHLHELRLSNITYYFDRYNCATLTLFLLSLLTEQTPQPAGVGVTPVDVVKAANRSGAIESAELISAPKWAMKMLSQALGRKASARVKSAVNAGSAADLQQLGDKEAFLASELTLAYAQWQKEHQKITDAQWQEIRQAVAASQANDDLQIDLSQYKTPLKTPEDSQLSLGYQDAADTGYATLEYIPAAHKIEDDNRQYFGDTELTLGKITARVSDAGQAELRAFTLYGIKSLIPQDRFTGGLSGVFQLGMRSHYLQRNQEQKEFYSDGALGITYELAAGCHLYGLGGLSLALGEDVNYLGPTVEAGLILTGPFNTKTLIYAKQGWFAQDILDQTVDMGVTQAFYLKHNLGLFLDLERSRRQGGDLVSTQLRLKRYF